MKRLIIILIAAITFVGCTQKLPTAGPSNQQPAIYPDYAGVTIPQNIAPLNFKLDSAQKAIAHIQSSSYTFAVSATDGKFNIPSRKWRKALQAAAGDTIKITIYEQQNNKWLRHNAINIFVAPCDIDGYLVYRRIVPGFHNWNQMGICQRRLSDYAETEIISNRLTDNNCMNCHSFCRNNPDKMLFHQRTDYAGTYFIENGDIEKVNTKNANTISALVYPSWHPTGRFVAFSTNITKQDMHLCSPNRIEVFDEASDVVVYDIQEHTIITNRVLSDSKAFETFPTFSPDGKRLYFCTAPAIQMPDSFNYVKYSIVAVDFDADTKQIGTHADTIYQARETGRSAKFPRVSPDGKYLLYTESDYGNFSIWHTDADLRMLNLETNKTDSLAIANSTNTESYHSWSSSGRWFVFSSRRQNGLYTAPYICYFDEQGRAHKPFLLPQKDADYYNNTPFSFNIPELITNPINVNTYSLVKAAKHSAATEVNYQLQ